MRKSSRNLLLLAVVTAVLGVAVYAELAREYRWLDARRLTDIRLSGVTSLAIDCRSCTTRRFERTATGWRMLEPYALPASSQAIAHLLAIARAPVRSWLTALDYDPARLGLQPAQITLQLNDTRIEVGNEDPIEHDRYVRVGSRLARVPDRFSARLFESAETELDRHLLAENPAVTGIVLNGASARTDLVHAWRTVVAAGVRRASADAAAGAVPVTVSLADGSSIHFGLIRAGNAYIARRDKPALDYVINEAQAQALLGKLK